jgi:hypothetical protein
MSAASLEEAERVLAGKFDVEDKPNALIADLLGEYVKDDVDRDAVDVITFCRAEWGLGVGTRTPDMFPVQRFILKSYYGMELDDTTADIELKDDLNEEVLATFTEKGFHDWLYEEHRTNTEDFNGFRNNLVLVAGRRASKTTIVSFIACYELYKLLLMYSPHNYYKIIPTDLIEIVSVSTNEGNAKNMFDRITGNIEASPFFKPYMTSVPNKLDMFFQTRSDIEKYGKGGRASIKLVAKPCSAKGLRGPNNIIVILDEAAFFFKETSDQKGSSNQSDTAIYSAVSPAMAAFKYPDGRPAGRMIMISSPADRTGKFYEEYERSLIPGKNKDLLMFKMPSWMVNKEISPDFLRTQKSQDPVVYRCEYGGEFSDRLRGWIEDPAILRQCVVPGLSYKERGGYRVPHFMGMDFGSKRDGSSVAIVHLEQVEAPNNLLETKIVVDVAEVRYAWKEKIAVSSDVQPYFTPDEIAEWYSTFPDRFHIVGGMMDHHYGMSIIPYLERKGFRQFESVQINDTKNSEHFQCLMAQLVGNHIMLPEGPMNSRTNRPDDSELVKELLSLQATQRSKHVISVEAPQREGCHDDLSDALVLAVWQAVQHMNKGFGGFVTNSTGAVGTALASAYRHRVNAEIRRMENNRSPRGPLRMGMRFLSP